MRGPLATTLLTSACLLAGALILLAAATGVEAATPSAQPVPGDNALQLLVIELFFLFVGLCVVAFLGYLIWASWRKKKEKGKAGKK